MQTTSTTPSHTPVPTSAPTVSPAASPSAATPRTAPLGPARGRGRLAAGLLVTGALLNGAESIGMRLLLPPQPESAREALALVAQHRPTYVVLAVLGTLAVPFMLAGFVALGRLAAPRSPRLARTAVALLGAGMWGFLGMHVVNLTQVPLSATDDVAGAAAALEAVHGSPVLGLLFLAPFLLGCALGLLLLAVALLRNPLPRWIPVTMLAFLVVDFGLRNGGPIDAHWLWIAASLGAARVLVSTDRPAAQASATGTEQQRQPAVTA